LFFALLVYFTIDIGKLKQDLKLLIDMVLCYKNLFTPCTLAHYFLGSNWKFV